MNSLDVIIRVIFNNKVRMFDNIVFFKKVSVGRYKIDNDEIIVTINRTIYLEEPLQIYIGCCQKIDEMSVFNEHIFKNDNSLIYLLNNKKIKIGYVNNENMIIKVSRQFLDCLEAIDSIKTNVTSKSTKTAK